MTRAPRNGARRQRAWAADKNRDREWQRGSGAGVSAIDGSGAVGTLERQTDDVAVVAAFAAVDNLAAEGNLFFQGPDLCHFAGAPGTLGDHTRAMSTDVIRVGQFCSVGRLILHLTQVHDYRNRKALFHSSLKSFFCFSSKDHVAVVLLAVGVRDAGLAPLQPQLCPTVRSVLN